MPFDYTLLRAKIHHNGFDQKDLAFSLGISTKTLKNKMNNKSEFKLHEMFKIIDILKISPHECEHYFFKTL